MNYLQRGWILLGLVLHLFCMVAVFEEFRGKFKLEVPNFEIQTTFWKNNKELLCCWRQSSYRRVCSKDVNLKGRKEHLVWL